MSTLWWTLLQKTGLVIAQLGYEQELSKMGDLAGRDDAQVTSVSNKTWHWQNALGALMYCDCFKEKLGKIGNDGGASTLEE